MTIFSIYDKVSKKYYNPFFFPNKEVCMRDLRHIINSDNSFQFVEDLALYVLGSFDERSGSITVDKPEFIVNLIDLKEVNNE